jgi:peroxiredoxin
VELPRLQPLYDKYSEEGLQVIAVESYRDSEQAKKFIEEKALTYLFLENGEGDGEVVRSTFDVLGYPTSYLIDRDGRIQYAHLGFEAGDEEKLEEEILSLL